MKSRVCFVLDDSASMVSIASDVQRVYNTILGGIRRDALKNGDDVRLTFMTFGERIEEHYSRVPVVHVADYGSYNPSQGSTKLFEAAGKGLKSLRNSDQGEAQLMIVLTDGQDNASWFYAASHLKADMDAAMKKGNYTLTFMLPPGAKADFVRRFGIPDGNVTEWEQTRKGVERVAEVVQSNYAAYAANVRSGSMSSTKFFTDLSGTSAKDIRAMMSDVSAACDQWKVMYRTRIDEFVKTKVGSYKRGYGYYQLVKPEEIQSNKRILLQHKHSGTIYGGPNARMVLGLPSHNVKVTPGDHGDYKIFVESTSDNRILPEGTELVHYRGGV